MSNVAKRDHDALCREYNETCEALGIKARMTYSATKAWIYVDVPGARISYRWDDANVELFRRRKQLAAKQADDAKLAALEPSKRYKQMTPAQFQAALNQHGLDAREFAFLTGADPRRTRRWLKGEEVGIPHWVTLVCTLFVDPAALPVARFLAEQMNIEKESV